MRFLLRCCAMLAVFSCTGVSAAADYGPLHDRFSIDLGTYQMRSDTMIRADEIQGFEVGLPLNLEDTFGFDRETVFRAEGQWRFAERHKLGLMYFDSNRSATIINVDELRFNGTTYPIGINVTAEFDFNILELSYGYQLVHRDTWELGASIGIHRVDLTAGLTASVTMDDADLSRTLQAQITTQVPLPVVGLQGTWNFAGDFYLQAHAQYFQLEYNGYDGSLQDYQLGVLWQFSRHFSIGGSYNLFDTRVDISNSDSFKGRLDWKYFGGQIFLRAGF